jgi:hypothetical protein
MKGKTFATELTKMKKQRLMRVTLWHENSLQMARKVTNSTFLITLQWRCIKKRREKGQTIRKNFSTTKLIRIQFNSKVKTKSKNQRANYGGV